jgi:hypothetical protein
LAWNRNQQASRSALVPLRPGQPNPSPCRNRYVHSSSALAHCRGCTEYRTLAPCLVTAVPLHRRTAAQSAGAPGLSSLQVPRRAVPTTQGQPRHMAHAKLRPPVDYGTSSSVRAARRFSSLAHRSQHGAKAISVLMSRVLAQPTPHIGSHFSSSFVMYIQQGSLWRMPMHGS